MAVGVGVAGVGLAVATTGMRVMFGAGVVKSEIELGALQATIQMDNPLKQRIFRKGDKVFDFTVVHSTDLRNLRKWGRLYQKMIRKYIAMPGVIP
jgi:hypothetical protein